MLSSSILALLAVALPAYATPIQKRSSTSFAGTNNYFLHALAESERNQYIADIAGYGAKMIRLWVSGTYDGCTKGSTTAAIPELETTALGSYNDQVLEALDAVLLELSKYNIKAIISPHNGNDLDSSYTGCDIYCTTYGSDANFYQNDDAKTAYDNRLSHILNYQSPNFNKPWSQLSEVIAGFDVQNEPFITCSFKAEQNDPDDWLCGRATTMAGLTAGSGVQVATGGIGGSQYSGHEYNLMPAALACSGVDIISMHGYMNDAGGWQAYIPSCEQTAAQSNKLLMIEEWGITDSDGSSQFSAQSAVFNDAGVPWLYWEVISGADGTQSCSGGCCHSGLDGFEIGIGSSKGNVNGATHTADSMTAAQDWSGIISGGTPTNMSAAAARKFYEQYYRAQSAPAPVRVI